MKKLYTITYTLQGKKNETDFMDVFANTITEAVKEFESVEFGPEGYKWSYTEYAITKIETK